MKSLYTFLIASLLSGLTIAQNVGVGTNNPASSAQLEVSSTNKGFLPPRMTAVQRDSIVAPVAGLIVYCTNCGSNGEVQVYNGNSWRNMIGSPASLPPVGQPYQGGILTYVLQAGDPGYNPNVPHGLIAAPVDQSAGIRWHNGTNIVTNATAVGIGTGNANTNTIISVQGPGSYAAQLCADLVLNGYGDWYLPSRSEFSTAVQVSGLLNLGDYWTSSEFTAPDGLENAWTVWSNLGDFFQTPKSTQCPVRAFRSF